MRLANKVALVTGAGSGFGAAIATTFAREGARVVLADLNEAAARKVAAAIGEAAIAVRCDVSKRPDVDAAVKAALDAFGRLDIVVNNAGVAHTRRPAIEVSEDEFDRVFAVNVKSIFHVVQAAVPALRRAGGGAIVNIGSTAGIRPRPGLTWYNASKGAVHIATKSLAVELAPDKIRVCALAPTIGETALLSTFMGGDTAELREKFAGNVPLGRITTPQDVANAALFFASAEAEFLTGTVLEIDGGRSV
jgi:3-oxoacyl-[acyl-carrier protein] reductase